MSGRPAERMAQATDFVPLVSLDSEEQSLTVTSSFLCFTMLMASYFVSLPLRDEIGISLGAKNLPFLFVASLFATIAAAPKSATYFSTGRTSKRLAHHGLLQFFSASFIVFFIVFSSQSMSERFFPKSFVLAYYVCARWAFFLWASLCNLLTVSTMWARLADVMTSQRATRFFGIIGAGATLGQLLGSLLASILARAGHGLLLLSAVLMHLSAQFALRITEAHSLLANESPRGEGMVGVWRGVLFRPVLWPRQTHSSSGRPGDEVGGYWRSVSAGARLVLGSAYLARICLALLMQASVSSLFYFLRAAVVAGYSSNASWRRQILANMNAASGLATLFIQLTFTSRILGAVGLPLALCASPLAALLGLMAVAYNPTAMLLAAVEALRKVVNYSLTRPSRELLFTVVPQEEKYVAKLSMDSLVQRLGDALSAVLVHILQEWLQLGPVAVALVGLPMCGLWMLVGYTLGGQQQAMAGRLARKPGESGQGEEKQQGLVAA